MSADFPNIWVPNREIIVPRRGVVRPTYPQFGGMGGIAANRRRSGGGGGGGFTPLSLSPLIWFDGDDAPSSGGNLTTGWPDLSGNGYNTSYVSNAPAPTVIANALNGHSVVDLSVSPAATVVQSWSHDIRELWTVFSYSGALPQSVGYPRMVQGNGGWPYLFLVNGTSNISADDTPYEYYPANPQVTNRFIMGFAATNSPGSNSEFIISNSSSGWVGQLAFVCGFSAQNTSPNRALMFTYLSARYGISYP